MSIRRGISVLLVSNPHRSFPDTPFGGSCKVEVYIGGVYGVCGVRGVANNEDEYGVRGVGV